MPPRTRLPNPFLAKLPRLVFVGYLLALATACSNIGRITLGVCGNHVLESGEDCDGAANCSADCHYRCDTTACPATFGCDKSAGICRAPTPEYEQTTLLSNSASRPIVTDFDGDGRDDLLLVNSHSFDPVNGNTPSSVYFFDLGLATTTILELAPASAAVGADIAGDSLPGIVLGGADLLAYRSLPGRRFSPILGGATSVQEHSQLYAADLDCNGRTRIVLREGKRVLALDSSGNETPLLDLDFNFAQEADISAAGALTQPGKASCEMLAILDDRASRVHIFGRHGADPQASLQELSSVALVAAPKVRGILFLDVNNDGTQDLIAQVEIPANSQVPYTTVGQFVAFGLGDGTFDSHALLPKAGAPDQQATRFDVSEAAGLLATGQFDDKPGLDYFHEASRGPGNSTFFYSQAAALDLTADGRTDVAAVREGSARDIDLLRGTPNGLFSLLPVHTDHAATLRGFADFDGDARPDLLLTEGQSQGGEQTTISVLFSPVTPATARVQELAELHGIESVATGYLEDSSGNADGIADIAVLSRDASGTLQVGFLEGGQDRLFGANLATTKTLSDALNAPIYTPLFGQFRAGQSREVAVIVDAPSGNQSALELFSLSASAATLVDHATLTDNHETARAETLDIDIDGNDEIYQLAANGSLSQLRVSGSGSSLQVQRLVVPLDSAVHGGIPVEMSKRDVNADRRVDLSVRADNTIVLFLAGEEQALTQPHILEMPNGACSGVSAHTWIQADADPALELAVVCGRLFDNPNPIGSARDSVLALFKVDLKTDTLTLVRSPPQLGPASQQLTVGDFNGDGVEDLASSDGELAILLGKPR